MLVPHLALRLLRLVNRHVKGKTYHRWRIGDLPKEIVDELAWEDGAELEASVRGRTLVLRLKK